MEAVTTVRRSLLPTEALGLLAQRAGVPLPPGWAGDGPDLGDPAELLVEAGLVDGPTGEVTGDLAAALAPLRSPLATVDVRLAPTAPRPPVPADQPAEAFTCALVLGDTGLVGLLRRDGVPLVELTLGGGDALRPSLERVLATVPEAPAESVEERLDLAAFTALSGFEGRFDPETFAAAYECDPVAVAAVAALLGTTTHALQVLVVGDRRRATPPVGQVLLYRSAPGWLDVSTEGADVVLRTTRPGDVLTPVARLLAGAL